jgi:hypothetical protein
MMMMMMIPYDEPRTIQTNLEMAKDQILTYGTWNNLEWRRPGGPFPLGNLTFWTTHVQLLPQ